MERKLSGAWHAALKVGKQTGTFKKYDINSAYLWSGMQGLPDTKTFLVTHNLERNAIYLADFIFKDKICPYPWARENRCELITTDDIDFYNVEITKIWYGIKWSNGVFFNDAFEYLDHNFHKSVCKKIYRGYWGRWMSCCKVKNENIKDGEIKRTWYMRNILANVIWAYIIISRVKRRLYTYADKSLHLFVDSMIVPEEVEVLTGGGTGEFREVAEYKQLEIICPGRYKDSGVYKKQSGIKILNA